MFSVVGTCLDALRVLFLTCAPSMNEPLLYELLLCRSNRAVTDENVPEKGRIRGSKVVSNEDVSDVQERAVPGCGPTVLAGGGKDWAKRG